MATLDEGEERYLTILLLFGEGSMFLLRHIIVKEEEKAGETLETLLLRNRHLFNIVLSEQCQFLYPSPTIANVDLNSWDMSLLLLVVKKLFSQGLPPHVMSACSALKGYRNSIQGHPSRLSMNESDYMSNRHHIMNILRNLATYVQQTAHIEDLITRTEIESIDIRTVFRHIKETQAFSVNMQGILEDKLQTTNQKLDSIETNMKIAMDKADTNEKSRKEAHDEIRGRLKSINESCDDFKLDLSSMKESVDSSKRKQEEAHGDVRCRLQALQESSEDTKHGLATVLENVETSKKNQAEAHDEAKQTLQSLKNSNEGLDLRIDKVAENVETSKKNQEEAHDEAKQTLQSLQKSNEGLDLRIDKLSETLKWMQRSNVQRTKHELTQELETIIDTQCDDEEKRKKAIDLLFTFVKIIQDNNKYNDLTIKSIIAQKINMFGELTLQLMDNMIELFTDIYEHCDGTDDARFGSIHLPIYCSSMNSLLTLLDYMYGNKSKQNMARISSTISTVFGASFSLSWKAEPISLQKAMSSFTKVDNIEPESSKKNLEKLILPFHTTDIKQVRNVWRMFGGEDKNIFLEKVSESLSKIFAENILLKTSIDKRQLLDVVNQTVEDKKRKINRSPGAALQQPSYTAVFLEPDASIQGLMTRHLQFHEVDQFSSSSSDISFLYEIGIDVKILRMVVIPNDRLLAIGRFEKKLYELDTSFNVVKAIELPDVSIDLCYIGEDKAAVCLFRSVIIVSTTMENSVETLSELPECASVTFHDNVLYCLDFDGHIYTYDTRIGKKKTIYTVQNVHGDYQLHEYFHNIVMPKGIAVSTDDRMIYINNSKELLTIDYKGHILSSLPLEYPLQEMISMEDGTILCSLLHKRELVQIDQNGDRVLRKIRIPGNQWGIYSICYNKANFRLILAEESEKIRVYELRQSTKEKL